MNKPTLLTSPEHTQKEIKYKPIQIDIMKNTQNPSTRGPCVLLGTILRATSLCSNFKDMCPNEPDDLVSQNTAEEQEGRTRRGALPALRHAADRQVFRTKIESVNTQDPDSSKSLGSYSTREGTHTFLCIEKVLAS